MAAKTKTRLAFTLFSRFSTDRAASGESLPRTAFTAPPTTQPTSIMAEETETFAFQAEINQLLSLIINVRRGSFPPRVPEPTSRDLFFVVCFSRLVARRRRHACRVLTLPPNRPSYRPSTPTRRSSFASLSGERLFAPATAAPWSPARINSQSGSRGRRLPVLSFLQATDPAPPFYTTATHPMRSTRSASRASRTRPSLRARCASSIFPARRGNCSGESTDLRRRRGETFQASHYAACDLLFRALPGRARCMTTPYPLGARDVCAYARARTAAPLFSPAPPLLDPTRLDVSTLRPRVTRRSPLAVTWLTRLRHPLVHAHTPRPASPASPDHD